MAAHEGLDETRMSIGEHLEELRWHVLRAVLVVLGLLMVALWQQEHLMTFATWPHRSVVKSLGDDRYFPGVERGLKDELLRAWEQDEELARRLDATDRNAALLRYRADPKKVEEEIRRLRADQDALEAKLASLADELEAAVAASERDEAKERELVAARAALAKERQALRERYEAHVLPFFDERAKVPRIELTQLKYTEAFLSSLKLCLVVALFVGSPLVVRELWAFVAKGLYAHEKRWVRLFGPLSFVAFILGGTFGYFVLIPTGLRFLIAYGSTDLVGATISLGDYLSLFVALTLVMGAIFELPLVMVFTTLVGVTNPDLFRRYRRHFILGSFVLGAVLTPTPDPFTQLLMVGPLYGLYELGIWLSGLVGKAPAPPAQPAPPPPPAPEEAPVVVQPKKPRPSVKLKPPEPAPAPEPAKPAGELAWPTSPPPATVARGSVGDSEEEGNGGGVPILPVPSDAGPIGEDDDEPIGGESEEPVPEPTLGDLGQESDVGFVGGSASGGAFDPEVEEPGFEQMGRRNRVSPFETQVIGGDDEPPPRNDEEPRGG